ncbi:hypothetical protein [Frankia sp. CiP3]|uniref:hypothetical protein n=1 Tax=Frankia sp. CiP3 TaxID=2880971 RepID=UPI001EF492C2|nr:hypothetical protein [Frankia sp. CiP3]
MPAEVFADGPPRSALVWLPAATLARLTALDDGVYVVSNPQACMLSTGHAGSHLALVQFAGETGHWASWTVLAGPVSVDDAAFCPAGLAVPEPGDGL